MRMGRKKFPKATGMPGMIKRNIWIIPWVVKTSLYVCAVIIFPGAIRLNRTRKPRITPTEKKLSKAPRYIMPIFL